MEFNKYMFGAVAIAALVGLQVAAWYFGFNGQVFAMTTSGITAILAFIAGYEVKKPPLEPKTQ